MFLRRYKENQMEMVGFGGTLTRALSKDNQWVQLSEIIPWKEIEDRYAELFADSGMGAPAKSARIAFGALVIQAMKNYTDEETAAQVTENPYLQYFLGMKEYQVVPLFDASMMVYFRKRFGFENATEINDMIIQYIQRAERPAKEEPPSSKKNDKDDDDDITKQEGQTSTQQHNEESSTNKGTLLLDATCAPGDIQYPTDLRLLNEGREKLERIIDTLYKADQRTDKPKKPRTYRNKARKQYLAVAKRPTYRAKQMRKAIGQQLRYVRRDLRIIKEMLKHHSQDTLNQKQREELETIRTLYRQQSTMYETKIRRIDHRIVSISQPHIRPIKRGKKKSPTEFGAKVAISVERGLVRIEKLSWENFNEATTMKESIERYYQSHGYYPEVVLVDKLYRNRENIRYCQERGIRITGPRLGRKNPQIHKEERKIMVQDARVRNAVEGKIGEGKRKYGLGLIRGKLKETSETMIAFTMIAMNLARCLRGLFFHFFNGYSGEKSEELGAVSWLFLVKIHIL